MKRLGLPVGISIFIAFILSMMQIQLDESMLLFDRFFQGAGWIQIAILTVYGGFLGYKMQDAGKSGVWRRRSWLIFSIWFFTQFLLGVVADERFLMTGKLHLPLPFMIAAGPVYRAQLTIMPILLLSSIVMTGPAWCSHYCYFGAVDQGFARLRAWGGPSRLRAYGLGLEDRDKEKLVRGKDREVRKLMRVPVRHKWIWKSTVFVVVIVGAWVFRMLGFSGLQTLIPALLLGGLAFVIMVVLSRRRGKMVHCLAFCPIGTLVNLGKYVSPFRMVIAPNCTNCMLCIPSCSYDALNEKDIKAGKPGLTCTYCGDCITSCKHTAIRYKFFKMSPKAARNLYLFLTISIHILCLGLARI